MGKADGHGTDLVSPQELRELAETANQPCVSIYMPTHWAAPDVQQDPIRLKNLLAAAVRQLEAAGLRTPDIQALVDPAGELAQRHNFWQHPAEGLAVFLAPGLFRSYRLPFEVEELVMTGQRLHLKPLLRLLRPDGRFYVLALSQSRVRLLEGSRYLVREVPLERVPHGLAEVLRQDDSERTLQFHTAAYGAGRGTGPGVFHGQGITDDAKSDIVRYFHRVDDGLREWLGPLQAPLVLASVEYLHPLYREANSYAHLLDEGLLGNPDDLRAEELHARAWDLVRPIFIRTREAAVERFRHLAGTDSHLASTGVKAITAAAHYGQVDSLFVQMGMQAWGRFDPSTGEVQVHNPPEPGDEDLLDLASVQTYLNGGTVYVVPEAQMPEPAAIAAIFRY